MDRQSWPSAVAGCVLLALAACHTTPKTPEPAPATPTATASPSPSPTPTLRAMPVETTPAPSIYDRTPGVLHEEKGRPAGAVATRTPQPGQTPARPARSGGE